MPNTRFYSRTQIILHWLIVVLVAIQYLAAEPTKALWEAHMSGALPALPVVDHHAVIGIVLLALTAWRLALVARNGLPPLPRDTAGGIRTAIRTIDVSFYVLIVVISVSGMSAWFFGNTGAIRLHDAGQALLLIVIAAHVAGALAQQFWLHNNVLKRMVGLR